MQKPEIYSKEIDKVSKLKTPKELFTFLKSEITVLFEISSFKIFVLNDSESEYVLKKNIAEGKDISMVAGDTKLALGDPIIKHLLDTKRAVSIKEVDENTDVALTENRRASLSLLRDKLIELGGEVCVPGFVQDKLLSVFILGKKTSKEEFSEPEIGLLSSLTAQSAKVIYNFKLLRKQVELFVDSIRKINNALEAKDVYTRGHSDRVARFSVVVGKKLHDELDGIPYGEIPLYYAAELHDIGKITLSDSVLKKEKGLDAKEWEEMKKHPLESVKIIEPLKKWFGEAILEGVLCHHENYDGSGYPYGKKGDEINILARIIRAADSFDAMITDRPYRKALTHHEAISELKAGRGTKFDPQVIDAFLEAYKQGLFKDIFFSQLKGES